VAPFDASRRKTRPRRRSAVGTCFALAHGIQAIQGGAVVEQVVHQVFLTVVGVTVTLLTVGLTGVIILLVTDRDTSHADPPRSA
jgi:hypothetical protein